MSAQPTVSPEQQLREDIAGFTHDPLGYVLYVYPWGVPGTELAGKSVRTWQREVLESIGEQLRNGAADLGEVIREAVASGHGIGKSALVSWIIGWALDTREDTRGVVTANTDTQLRTKTWPEVRKWRRMGLTSHWFDVTATAIVSRSPGRDKNWRFDAVPWSEHNTEAFAGLHNEGKRLVLIFDEASAIADKVWEVAEGALTDEGTEIIWCAFGNATRSTGRFRECFRKFKHRWRVRQIDSRNVEGTNKIELAKFVADNGENSDRVKVRIRGMFPSMSAKQFIGEADIDAAFGRHLRPDQYEWAPKILCVDPAWDGGDTLEIGLRQGLVFRILLTLPKNDNDVDVANKIARLEDEHRADAVFIDGGYGTGIVSVGRTLNRDWTLVWFSGESSDPGYLNKRAEMCGLARDWFKEGGAIPNDQAHQELRDEALAINTKPRLDGKIQIESKEEIRKVLGRSPNKFDCLCISFAYPVAAKPRLPDGTVLHDTRNDSYLDAGSAGEPYNPFR